MKIKFLGTGAAEGVPAMFCNCDYCKKIRILGEREYRTRTQVLVDDCLCIDFPPEAYVHSLKYGYNLSRLKYLLVTHSHMDHFYAHDFILRGYKYGVLYEDKLEIYGNSEVAKVFAECTAREMKPEVSPHVNFNEITPFCDFEIGGYRVISLPANHSKTEDALLYYIGKNGQGYLHLYDTGRISDRVFDFLAKKGVRVNIVAFDCTFAEHLGGENSRHMGIEDNMLMKYKLSERRIIDAETRIIITHFSHNSNPLKERLSGLEKKYDVTAAYDGFEVEI